MPVVAQPSLLFRCSLLFTSGVNSTTAARFRLRKEQKNSTMSKRTAKLSHDVEARVIQQFQKHTVLWDSRVPDVSQKAKRDTALQTIIKDLGLQITKEDLWEKLEQIKASFFRELSKVKEKQKKEENYEPRFVHYRRLLFLQHVTPLAEQSHIVQSPVRCTEPEVLLKLSSDESDSEEENDSCEPPSKGGKIGTDANGSVLRRAFKSSQGDAKPLSRLSVDEIQVAVNFLKAMDKDPEDECDNFGKYVASALRRMTPYNKEFAKLKIQQVFLDLSLSSPLQTTHDSSTPM